MGYNRDNKEHYDRDNRRKGYNQRNNYNRRWVQNTNSRTNYDQRQQSFSRSRQKYHQKKWSYKKQLRQVMKVQVQGPKIMMIAEGTTFSNNDIKFIVRVKVDSKVPQKSQTKLAELKNRITPIEKIWTSHIKQYLNNSQFVEIYRQKRSLSYGQIQYGKTIIKYDEQQKMIYQNQSAQIPIFSRAYFKLWEIISLGILQDKNQQKINIAAVAEGPGGFIHALIDYRQKNSKKEEKDSLFSITLKIDKQHTRNAKDWSDNRGKKYFQLARNNGYKIKLSYGSNGTGDLLIKQNIDYFTNIDLAQQKCYLVTGDGGIQCIGDKQFDYQELFNAKLFLGEIICALKIQQKLGYFILKVYDCSFVITKQLIILLSCFYSLVRIIKPVTSRPGNSQKYILCQKFKGCSEKQLLQLITLLKQWTQQEPNLSYFQNLSFVNSILEFPNLEQLQQINNNLNKANEYFINEQQVKLEQGLNLVKKFNNDKRQIQNQLKQHRFAQQIDYAYAWCKKYGLTSIDVKQRSIQTKIDNNKIVQQQINE